MPTIVDFDAKVGEFVSLTGIGAQELKDFLLCTPEQQAQIVQNYKDMDWTKQSDTFNKVLDVISAIDGIAAAIPVLAPYAAGVAGAIAAIKLIQSF